jgi:hypothetical protein
MKSTSIYGQWRTSELRDVDKSSDIQNGQFSPHFEAGTSQLEMIERDGPHTFDHFLRNVKSKRVLHVTKDVRHRSENTSREIPGSN